MRIRLKGLNSKRKRLADGRFKMYWYAWKGGPPLRGEPGTPEFMASYNEAVSSKIAAPSGVLLALLFQFQDSAEFKFSISPRTRKDYIKQIKRIERAFGDFPIKAIPGHDLCSSNGVTGWRKLHCGKPTMPMALWRAFFLGRTIVD
jgi:hypothetical protein